MRRPNIHLVRHFMNAHRCEACGRRVHRDDPQLTYRGRVFHEKCCATRKKR